MKQIKSITLSQVHEETQRIILQNCCKNNQLHDKLNFKRAYLNKCILKLQAFHAMATLSCFSTCFRNYILFLTMLKMLTFSYKD